MQPWDCLTAEDKEIVRQWCINYASVEPQSIEKILTTWNKNKRTLFRAFGKKLSITFPIHQKVNSSYRKNKWRELYSPFPICCKADLKYFKFDPRNHIFINSLMKWLRDEQVEKMTLSTLKNIIEYTKYCHVENGKTSDDKIFVDNSKDKILKIPRGTKIMRAIRKVLEYYDFPYMESFNKWRDDISVINTDREIDAELVLSINPVDFITMSDNRSGWTSCMSWIDNGAYSTGTIEMLNSNLAIVAYLRNAQCFDYNGLEIPNKAWRTLVFMNKQILLVGKHYPYQSEVLANIILDKLQETVKTNLNWKYKYKNQLYRDMIYSYSNNYIRDDLPRVSWGHKIYVYTDIMYHDIIEDHATDYWCCRNYVNKNLYLNLSGPATCMCCGEKIKDEMFYSSTSKKYCRKCFEHFKCYGCGMISAEHSKNFVFFKEMGYYTKVQSQGCPDCLINTYLWDKKNKALVPKNKVCRVDGFSSSEKRFVPLTRERISQIEVCNSLPNKPRVVYDFSESRRT